MPFFFVGVSFAGAVGVLPAAAGFGFAGVGVTSPPAGAGVAPGGGVAVGAGAGVPNHPGGYVLSPPPPPDGDDFVVPTSAMVLRLVTFTQT